MTKYFNYDALLSANIAAHGNLICKEIMSALSAKLVEGMNSPDNEALMDRCDQMYSAQFHSGVPFRAGDCDEDDLYYSGFTFNSSDLDAPSHSEWMSEQDEGDDYSVARYNAWVKRNFKSKTLITPETMLVDVCNYKGEGEGYAVYESVRGMPVFRSKNDSFAAFNV